MCRVFVLPIILCDQVPTSQSSSFHRWWSHFQIEKRCLEQVPRRSMSSGSSSLADSRTFSHTSRLGVLIEYTTLGSTDLSVSRLCLGCMSFSESGDDWTLDAGESRAVIERAIDLGITFFDTANVYSVGESESILGDVLAEYDRDEFVIATKVYGEMGDHLNASSLSEGDRAGTRQQP